MFNGTVVGVVKDNVDPEKMHRVLVEFPSESTDKKLESYWCRVSSPMAGKNRGLVMIPDIGTEVILAFAYKSNTPYILGAVYNGKEDKPEPYKNDDEKNNLRVFWSRNDHLVIFDDTEGEEKVEFGAQASSRLDVTSAPIYQSLDSAKKTITEYCDKDTEWEAKETISIKCKDFTLEASNSITMKSGSDTHMKAGASFTISAGAIAENKGADIHCNSGKPASPQSALPFPKHKHPPTS
ncbi:MAG: phage baseplate assembly protein V [Myxococcota bacterium]|nr:phage baseplate assembly protein V [Myxococcota bacterium]